MCPAGEVTMEATHHGPLIDTPVFFVEIGSSAEEWSRADAGDVLARAVLSAHPDSSRRIIVGIGGSHYAPRPTHLALHTGVDIGHVVPSWALESVPGDITQQSELSELTANYLSETFFGETVISSTGYGGKAGELLHLITDAGDNREHARVRSVWRRRER